MSMSLGGSHIARTLGGLPEQHALLHDVERKHRAASAEEVVGEGTDERVQDSELGDAAG